MFYDSGAVEMGNIFKTIRDSIAIQNMSLETVHNVYGEGPEFYRELLRRSKKNLGEALEYFRSLPEQDFSDLQDKCDLLKITPTEMLSWGNVRMIPDYISKAYLVDNADWLLTPVADKVSKSFLADTFNRDDNIYKYTSSATKMDERDHYRLMIDPALDYSKFESASHLLDRFSDINIHGIVRNLLENRKYEALMIISSQPFVKEFVLGEVLLKCTSLPFGKIMRMLDTFPDEFVKTFLSDYIDFLFYNIKPEEVLEILRSNVILKFYPKSIGKVLGMITYSRYDKTSVDILWIEVLNRKLPVFDEALTGMITSRCRTYHKTLDELDLPAFVKDRYVELVLGPDAPKELVERFRHRGFDLDYINAHSEYESFFRKLNLELIFSYIPISTGKGKYEDFSEYLKRNFDVTTAYDVLREYEPCLKTYYEKSNYTILTLKDGLPIKEVKDVFNRFIYDHITDSKIRLIENGLDSFFMEHPEFSLPQNAPEALKNKFYERRLSPKDFVLNKEWLNFFDNVNLAYGFPSGLSFLITLQNGEDIKKENEFNLKVFETYERLSDTPLKILFLDMIRSNRSALTVENIDMAIEILRRINNSRYDDLIKYKNISIPNILNGPNPLQFLDNIEKILLRDNVPFAGKIYTIFQLMHPNMSDFDFKEYSKISPMLKSKSSAVRQILIFSDLMKAALGSNNRSLREYLIEIERGYTLFERASNDGIDLSEMSPKDREILTKFLDYLTTLYESIRRSGKEEFKRNGNLLEDIEALRKIFTKNGQITKDLPDRIVKMYCHFAGFDTMNSIKIYMTSRIRSTDIKHRIAANQPFKLKKGDLIKGLGNVEYLSYILQNGVLSKEFLGILIRSDGTPLDTDLSMVKNDTTDFAKEISLTMSKDYGPIWIVLKRDDRFTITRDADGEKKGDINKLELFQITSPDHYGIRTGFASTEIDYFVMEEVDKRVFLEIALNGFYIPVVDMKGHLLFTPQDFDILRTKMTGIANYTDESFHLSPDLKTINLDDLENKTEMNRKQTEERITKIREIIRRTVESLGLKLSTSRVSDMTPGTVELLSTGSTSRNTNQIGKGDFDFIMRLDKEIIDNREKFNLLKRKILAALGQHNLSDISGDLKMKSASVDGEALEIQISFARRSKVIALSTDEAVKLRLDSIKSQGEEQYKSVIANILFAKKILSDAGVYKPSKKDKEQGGLGGIGIENWILQNGGSFLEAAISFLNASNGKTFWQFKKEYEIWDFGENYLASRYGIYSHDNFIEQMNEKGYEKMQACLKAYLVSLEKEKEKSLPNLS